MSAHICVHRGYKYRGFFSKKFQRKNAQTSINHQRCNCHDDNLHYPHGTRACPRQQQQRPPRWQQVQESMAVVHPLFIHCSAKVVLEHGSWKHRKEDSTYRLASESRHQLELDQEEQRRKAEWRYHSDLDGPVSWHGLCVCLLVVLVFSCVLSPSACVLLQLRGFNVLFDPIFSDRCSPVQFGGPKRYTEPPCKLSELPPIDAVVISHNQ